MRSALDHLVYATPDLPATVEDLARRTGVQPGVGGRHPGFGTANALLRLQGGAYLEVIGPDPGQPEPDRPRPFGIDELAAPLLAGWAVRPDDFEACLAASRAAGHDPGEVAEMSRARPDGVVLRWRLSLRPEGLVSGVVPFLIDWRGSPHPADTAPAGLALRDLVLEHPEPGALVAVLLSLGVDVSVRSGAAPALRATVIGPGGSVVLE